MGFINNYRDNFLQSNSPWGDDNVTVYNLPQKERVEPELRPEDLGYDQIDELITQFNEVIPTLNERDAVRVDKKLSKLQEEKQKRDSLEEVTRKERGDAFEFSNTIVKEDVPEAKVVVEPKPIPPKKPILPSPIVEIDIDEELLELELEDLLQQRNAPPVQVAGIDNTDNFLIASMIIITVILITK